MRSLTDAEARAALRKFLPSGGLRRRPPLDRVYTSPDAALAMTPRAVTNAEARAVCDRGWATDGGVLYTSLSGFRCLRLDLTQAGRFEIARLLADEDAGIDG